MSTITFDTMLIILGGVLLLGILWIYLLTKQRQKFKQLIDFAIEGLIISHKGCVVEINAQALKLFGGTDKEEILGKSMFKFIAPESKELVQQQSEKSHSEMYECMLLRKNGTSFPALVRGSDMISFGKKMRVSAVIDLSELKEAQYALQALNDNLEMQVQTQIEKNRQQEMMLFQQSRHAQMGEMISMIAHQWRQPLAAIAATTSFLSAKLMLEEVNKQEFEEEIGRIETYVSHLSKTIDDFRDFFKFSPSIGLPYFCFPIILSHSINDICLGLDKLIIAEKTGNFSFFILALLLKYHSLSSRSNDLIISFSSSCSSLVITFSISLE